LKGTGVSRGAITVVNAIPSGRGAAIGIDLQFRADVELNESDRIMVIEDGEEHEDKFVAICVKKVLYRFDRESGARVWIKSSIPPRKGLKSSSACTNAVILGTADALGERMRSNEVLMLGKDASIEAGVSITGAIDDAAACLMGGLVLTDNLNGLILKKMRVDPDLRVVVYLPDEEVPTSKVDVAALRKIRTVSEEIFQQALKGRYAEAMVRNGLVCSAVLGYDISPALDALEAGAVAAGLSGKGPAVAAMCNPSEVDRVTEVLSKYEGRIISTQVYNADSRA
jgi:shikimate kinase